MIDFLDVLAGLFCYVLAFSRVSYHIFAGCLFRWFAKSVISRCVCVLSLCIWHLACCRVHWPNDFALSLHSSWEIFLPLDVWLFCSGSNSLSTLSFLDMDVSENSGTPKSSILIGFSMIFTIHFGLPLFLETPTLYLSWPFVPCNGKRACRFVSVGQMRKRMRDFLRLRPTDCPFSGKF